MQSSKPKNNKDRFKNKQPARQTDEPNPVFYPTENRRKNNQGRFNRRYDDDDHYYQKHNNQKNTVFIYKQDLLQKGFDVFQSSKVSTDLNELTDTYSECFNSTKRKVILENFEQSLEEVSELEFSQSKIHAKDELKKDFGHLLENEDIPDWFLENNQTNHKLSFDFGTTVSRTLNHNREKAKVVHSGPFITQTEKEAKNEINFEELDKIIETEYIKSKAFIQSDDEDMFELEIEKNEEMNKDNSIIKPHDEHFHNQSYSAHNDSFDYFTNLHSNLKNVIFNDRKQYSDDENGSEESFQESLGFEAKREGKGINKEMKNQVFPTEKVQVSFIEDLQSSIRSVEQIMMFPNTMSANQALGNRLNIETNENDAFKKAIENDETLKMSQETKEQRQRVFMNKYGYLDPIMCQLCYEILVSKNRISINSFSSNGFNQKSVEKYCSNKYKIFSLFLQGDIITKTWFYKDKTGLIMGPFMSYDMDIWNGEGNYFSNNQLVSLDKSPFLYIQLWVNRSNLILKFVDEFIRRSEEMKKMNPQIHKNRNHASEKRNFDKKISFHKKNENKNASYVPQKTTNNDELNKNFTELFPAIEENDYQDKMEKPESRLNQMKNIYWTH